MEDVKELLVLRKSEKDKDKKETKQEFEGRFAKWRVKSRLHNTKDEFDINLSGNWLNRWNNNSSDNNNTQM